ncbi:hypothetical protein LCGC14_0836720 [marine sediment metagenome]|uniref:Uncharacterized protein n=1 Tax=marine sediment metagenome TaxID=412755 RepID=A0A0F9SLL3_9ZZZZ
MPFKSKSQRKWMYANKPEMARKWEAETSDKNLPARVSKKKKLQEYLAKHRR